MNWFLAKIIFLIEQEDTSSPQQFDEQIRLVQAEGLQEALAKTEIIAYKEEQEFLNSDHKMVSWKFLGIPEVYSIGQLEDGKELYSFTPETEDTSTYIEYIKQRYSSLKHRFTLMQPVV